MFFGKVSYAAYITNPPNENDIQWKLDDNAADTTVTGSEVNGSLVGGNTSDVHATLNGFSTFHLNGSSQYITVAVPNIWPSARQNLWSKNTSNPVLSDSMSVMFGQLTKNPLGGWYFFGARGSDIDRWESTDLINWSNRVTALSAGSVGSWDHALQVASVFQKPNGNWIMLYRGSDGTNYKIGLATNSDGTTFSRKNNGGVNDGLFPQFGSNFDPVGIILVGSTYYVFLNGSPNHGVSNVYYSTDDFNTFIVNPNNPISPRGISRASNGAFCAGVWHTGNYYYMLINRDFNQSGSSLYDHGIGLYRSTVPMFDATSTEFLGYSVVNDQSYDNRYLDTPSVPMTDVYRTTYAPEFGDTLYMLYTGADSVIKYTQNLASTTFEALTALKQRVDMLYANRISYSFWIQFDTLTNGDPIFSVGSSATDDSPVWLGVVKTSGANKVLSLFLEESYRDTSQVLSINTPYHVVISDDTVNRSVYVNDNLVGTISQAPSNGDSYNLYIGKGYGTRFLDGYVWDYRIYPKDLSTTEVAKLYTTGSIDITAPVTTDNTDNSWHNTDVAVTLVCTDTNGAGCANTYYTTDGTDPTVSSLSGTSITLSTDGIYTIKYFSVDANGNQETIKTATNTVKIDKISPTLTSLMPISTPSTDTTPSYIFSSTEAGTLLYTGSCIPGSTSISSGANTITFNVLPDGTYTNCKISVIDSAGNDSATTTLASFIVDTTAPVSAASISGSTYTGAQSVSLSCSDAGSGCDKIYYTTDGSTPTVSSQTYSTPIAMNNGYTVLKLFATDLTGNSEAVHTENYMIIAGSVISPAPTTNSTTQTQAQSATPAGNTNNPPPPSLIREEVNPPIAATVEMMLNEAKAIMIGKAEIRLTDFINNGTASTKILGSGERAGVVNSYQLAFGRAPQTEADWSDVIKIANGRWPSQRSKTAEDRATVNFRKVYLRNPDRFNPHDDAAITIMAYGLRPAMRNLDSERAAIKTFRAIYGHAPKSASAWDIVRAIAYSGAKR